MMDRTNSSRSTRPERSTSTELNAFRISLSAPGGGVFRELQFTRSVLVECIERLHELSVHLGSLRVALVLLIAVGVLELVKEFARSLHQSRLELLSHLSASARGLDGLVVSLLEVGHVARKRVNGALHVGCNDLHVQFGESLSLDG